MSLLAVGTVALDHIETPYAHEQNVLGGSATFIGLAARFFSEDVRLVAVVGGDFPEAYTRTLRDAGLRLDGLDVKADGKIGPRTVRALQDKVGAKVDGDWGSSTTRSLQKFLRRY